MAYRLGDDRQQMKSCQGSLQAMPYNLWSMIAMLIVQIDAVNDANDRSQLADQINDGQDNLRRNCKVACADAGYSNISALPSSHSEGAGCRIKSGMTSAHYLFAGLICLVSRCMICAPAIMEIHSD